MARPPSANSIIANAKKSNRVVETHADIASGMILPNNSGDHSKGIKRDVPINDYDLSNKKYVDDEISGIDLTPYWKSDGTSTCSGNWNLGTYDLTTTGSITAAEFIDSTSGGTSTEWETAWTHSQDNTQAHTDYLINNGNDVTAGGLQMTYLIITEPAQNYKFKKADYAVRDMLILQSQTNGKRADLWMMTKQGDGTDSVGLDLWTKGTPASVSNRERLRIGQTASSNAYINMDKAGTGVARPIHIYTYLKDGQLTLETDGDVSMNQGDLNINADNKGVNMGATLTDFKLYSDGNNACIDFTGDLKVNGTAGWTGTFTNGDGATVTVADGIITGVA